MTRKFEIGDRVRKVSGSSWQGHVCGFYSTTLTPQGYCVESEREIGSVQLYPESALELMPTAKEPDLEHQLATVQAALKRLRAYAASVWFDEADASDEERKVMEHARNVLKGK